ncbi:reverse transcriptase domain-containing protein [Tanacetum coccineum]
MTQAAIRQLIADGIAAALEAQQSGGQGRQRDICYWYSTDDALVLWNAYAKIGMEQANRITWTELKRLLTNKYCPRTEVKKMENEFYNLAVKGNDLKTYVRRFQELAVLCLTLVTKHREAYGKSLWGYPEVL